MKRLVQFALEEGGSVVVEVDEPPGTPVTRGIGKDHSALVGEADKTFEAATAAVTPAARSLIARLQAIENPPDEVSIQFGVQLSAQTGGVHRRGRGRGQLHGVHDLAAPGRRQWLSGGRDGG